MSINTSTALTVSGTLHFARRGRGGRREGQEGERPAPPAGRVPRVARLMALALKFDRLIRDVP